MNRGLEETWVAVPAYAGGRFAYHVNDPIWAEDCGADSCTWWPGVVNARTWNNADLSSEGYFVSYKAKGVIKTKWIERDMVAYRNQSACKGLAQ